MPCPATDGHGSHRRTQVVFRPLKSGRLASTLWWPIATARRMSRLFGRFDGLCIASVERVADR